MVITFISSSFGCRHTVVTSIAVPAGGAGGAIAPPSFEDLGKIKIFRAVRRKYLGKTIVFRAAIWKIWAKSGNLERWWWGTARNNNPNLGEDLTQTIFLSYPKCTLKSWFGQTSQNLGKTSLPPKIFWAGTAMVTRLVWNFKEIMLFAIKRRAFLETQFVIKRFSLTGVTLWWLSLK